MFFDPAYWILIVVIMAMSGLAALWVRVAFNRGKKVPLSSGLSGADIARAILRQNGIDDVQVVESRGFLSDHYNPMNKSLGLSPDVYHGRTASAAGVAAHEVGHALQHAHGSIFMWMRSLLVPVAGIGSNLGPWIVILGMFLGSAQGLVMGETIAWVGVILFGLATLFTVITVPVEFDASARAKHILKDLGLTRYQEEDGAIRSVLTAAGMTYVAAAAGSILMLLYWAWRAGLLGGRDD